MKNECMKCFSKFEFWDEVITTTVDEVYHVNCVQLSPKSYDIFIEGEYAGESDCDTELAYELFENLNEDEDDEV